MKEREALKLAMDFIERTANFVPISFDNEGMAICANIKEILAQPKQERPQNCGTGYCSCIECVMEPEQEPVAWGNLANWCLDSDRVLITDKDEAAKYHRDVYDLTPLYTTPLQRTWVELTDEEMQAVVDAQPLVSSINVYFKAIEAKLKEKNT